MKTSHIFLVLLTVSVTGKVFGQEETSAKLTFREAVKIGLENNVNLNQQKNLLVTSRVAKTSGLLQLGPTVSINGNVGRRDGNSFNQQEGAVINGVLDFTSASLNANLPIFNGLSGISNFRQANSLYEAQLSMVNRTSQDVISNVSAQYLTCLLDQELVKINQKNLETQQKQFDQIKEQVNAGSRAEVDLLNQEYQVKNAELLVLRSKFTLRNDKATLAQIIQLDPSVASFELEEPSWQLTDLTGLSLDELYTIAEQRRSDLEQARQSEKAAQFGYHAVKGGYFPSLNAFASYGSTYNYIHPSEVIPNPGNRTFDQQFFSDNTVLTYGVTFFIPIHNAFQNRTNTVRNRMQYENARIQAKGLETTVKNDVLRAYQNLQDAQANAGAAEAQLKAAEIAYNLERERYELGISDIVALTQVNQAYTRAQGDHASARYTLMFQHLLINYAVGTLKFEDIP